MTMDRVFIDDLRIQTVIGIFDWEREITQTISLDLQMAFDARWLSWRLPTWMVRRHGARFSTASPC